MAQVFCCVAILEANICCLGVKANFKLEIWQAQRLLIQNIVRVHSTNRKFVQNPVILILDLLHKSKEVHYFWGPFQNFTVSYLKKIDT